MAAVDKIFALDSLSLLNKYIAANVYRAKGMIYQANSMMNAS